jgi:hypothetical protein
MLWTIAIEKGVSEWRGNALVVLNPYGIEIPTYAGLVRIPAGAVAYLRGERNERLF